MINQTKLSMENIVTNPFKQIILGDTDGEDYFPSSSVHVIHFSSFPQSVPEPIFGK